MTHEIFEKNQKNCGTIEVGKKGNREEKTQQGISHWANDKRAKAIVVCAEEGRGTLSALRKPRGEKLLKHGKRRERGGMRDWN